MSPAGDTSFTIFDERKLMRKWKEREKEEVDLAVETLLIFHFLFFGRLRKKGNNGEVIFDFPLLREIV